MKSEVSGVVRGVASVFLLSLAAACGESSTAPGGEQEFITRVTLTLTPAGGGAAVVAYINDPDGAGPLPPESQSGALALSGSASYTGTVKFENRLENPPEDITSEVAAESNEHRVLYTVTGADLTIATTDVDSNGRPLGITFSATTGATAGNGAVRVVLCHYGDITKPAVATSCTGDTDIDTSFSFSIAP